MTVEVHVEGKVERGRFAEFLDAAERPCAYRQQKGMLTPRILQGLAGEMNTVQMVFTYPEFPAYEREEAMVTGDR